MTIRHLKIFLAVADCGKMSLAAKQLYLSQPTVSQAVQELEAHYGVQLFDRLSQRLYITESGRRLVPLARHSVEAFEAAELAMKNAGQMPALRIGASVTVGTCLLQRVLAPLEAELPALQLHITVNNSSAIERLLLDSTLDTAVVEGLIEDESLCQHTVMQDELVLVAGPSHPFYTKKEISLADLSGQPLISREDGSTARNQYEQLLAAKQIRMPSKWSSTNTESIKNAVANGEGLAILSALLVEKEVAAGALRVVPVRGVHVRRDIRLVYHKDKYISPQLARFHALCLSAFQASPSAK